MTRRTDREVILISEGRGVDRVPMHLHWAGPLPTLVFRPQQQLAVHLWKHGEALEALETGIRSSRRLENLCRDFELQKVCYLPLNTFLLRPLHRLMHYKQVLERLCKDNPPNEADFRDCRGEQLLSDEHSFRHPQHYLLRESSCLPRGWPRTTAKQIFCKTGTSPLSG